MERVRMAQDNRPLCRSPRQTAFQPEAIRGGKVDQFSIAR